MMAESVGLKVIDYKKIEGIAISSNGEVIKTFGIWCYNIHMTHKAIFFNLKRVGDDGEKYLEASEKLKARAWRWRLWMRGSITASFPTDKNFDILAVFMDLRWMRRRSQHCRTSS